VGQCSHYTQICKCIFVAIKQLDNMLTRKVQNDEDAPDVILLLKTVDTFVNKTAF